MSSEHEVESEDTRKELEQPAGSRDEEAAVEATVEEQKEEGSSNLSKWLITGGISLLVLLLLTIYGVRFYRQCTDSGSQVQFITWANAGSSNKMRLALLFNPSLLSDPVTLFEQANSTEATQLLISVGAADQVDKCQRTVLHRLIMRQPSNLGILSEICNHPAVKVDAQDNEGKTALMLAFEKHQYHFAIELIKKTKNFALVDKEKQTVLHKAVFSKQQVSIINIIEKIDALEKAEASPIINAADIHGNTALHYASDLRLINVRNKLLSLSYINISINNCDSKTQDQLFSESKQKQASLKK